MLNTTLKNKLISYPEVGEDIDKYKIVGIINKGFLSRIYKVYHDVIKKHVAIRVLSPNFINFHPEIKDLLISQIKHNVKLKHPELIKIIDVGRNDIYTYYVMEYVNGENLDKTINYQGKISPDETINIAKEIVKVLKYCFKYGYVHKGIKPSNIIITKENKIKLSEFGLRELVIQPDKNKLIRGEVYNTPYFMAPEHFLKPEIVDYRSDIYALGATLYYMLTGVIPYDYNDISKIIYMKMNTRSINPSTISPNIPKELSNIVLKMMDKNPDNRFQDYDEIYQRLKDLSNEYTTFNEEKDNNQELKLNN